MIVVGDASVYIALGRIDALSLLPRLYKEVHVPDAVWCEIDRPGFPPPEWIIRHSLSRPLPSADWTEPLDAGESEALHLARQLHAALVLIDEAAGRAVARRLGLEVTGTVGLLVDAKRRGLLTFIRPLLDRLRQSGFWLSSQVYQAALTAAGE